MAHGNGPAPVSAFALVILTMAAPLAAQDPAVAAQNALKQCESVYIACGKACIADTCKACDDARELCRAEVYSTTGVPTPRSPAGWVVPGTPVIVPPGIPGVTNPAPPRPFPSPRPHPTPPPATELPVATGQKAERCNPDDYESVLNRYRDGTGVPTREQLMKTVNDGIVSQDGEIAAQQKIIDDPDTGFFKARAAKKRLEKAQQKRDAYAGVAKLLDEASRSGKVSDSTMIGLKLALDRVGDDNRGLAARGGVASASVWYFGSDASVIRDGSPSYHDKQNSLGHILAEYGAGEEIRGVDDDQPVPELVELAAITARDTLIAACRAEPMTPPRQVGGGSGSSGGANGFGECNGTPLKSKQECCTADGIGRRAAGEKAVDDCPAEERVAKLDYKPARNGCGVPVTDALYGDMPDNPNFHSIPPVPKIIPGKRIRVYFGPSFFPACDFHDDCWGTCHTKDSGLSQSVCDAEFGRRMGQLCDAADLSWPNRAVCHYNSFLYVKMVQGGALALGAYDSGQAAGCDCCQGGKA
ncbi:MAG TPA: hypothetical protein VEK11_21550 [Thermoanaerobaculia bacterium]|nr:hypothetical protein [Thermoanaerobaculia bacterium]